MQEISHTDVTDSYLFTNLRSSQPILNMQIPTNPPVLEYLALLGNEKQGYYIRFSQVYSDSQTFQL